MSDPPVTPLDRILEAFRLLVRNEDPQRTYFGTYEYSVQASYTNNTLDLLPTDPTAAPPLPAGVPYTPSLPGTSSTPAKGALAYVTFANGSPTKPIVMGFNLILPGSATVDATGPVNVGPSASSVVIAARTPVATSPGTATAERRIVCYGDTVSVGSAAGAVTLVGPTCSKGSA